MLDFDLTIKAVDLHFLAEKARIPPKKVVAELHALALNACKQTAAKAANSKYGWGQQRKTVKLLDTGVKINLNCHVSKQDVSVNVTVNGNKKLKFKSHKIESYVTESMILGA